MAAMSLSIVLAEVWYLSIRSFLVASPVVRRRKIMAAWRLSI